MLKFEIVKCIKSFNKDFNVNELYKAFPNKRGQIQVFVDDEKHLITPEDYLIISDQRFYLNFFEPVASILLKDVETCEEMRLKSVDGILRLVEMKILD